MFLLARYFGEEGVVEGITDCCILLRELDVIVVISQPFCPHE